MGACSFNKIIPACSLVVTDYPFCSRTTRRVRIHARLRRRFKDLVLDNARIEFIQVPTVGLLTIWFYSWIRGRTIGPREPLRQPEEKDPTP